MEHVTGRSGTAKLAGMVLVLAACEGKEPSGIAAVEQTTTATMVDERVPASLHGRWGLVPADCEPGRADAKGLLLIDRESLEFYESVAQLGDVAASDAHGIRADFEFTGEGMEWTREIELAIEDGGNTMVRRELGEGAADGPLVYTRCG